MTAQPSDPGEWWQRDVSTRSWWARLLCRWFGHRPIDVDHVHGELDPRWCRRCWALWSRDGCAARSCGAEGGGE